MFTTPFRTSRPRLAAGIVGSTLALAALSGLGAASAHTPAERAATAVSSSEAKAAKPTIVLVHGAWADASSFAGVERKLIKDGYTVLSFANPLRSLTTDSENLAAFLAARTSGPVILVGHSYGGAVISSAGLSDRDVRGLVYVDGFLPAKGQSVADLQSGTPSDPTQSFDFVPYAGAPEGDFDLYLKKEIFPLAFANGVNHAKQEELYAGQRPITLTALNQKAVGTPAWKKLPSWYIAGTEDHSVSIDLQREMAARASSKLTTFKTGHLTMVQRPGAVAKIIETAATTTK